MTIVSPLIAAAMGILLWNAPFLTLGYALRGVGHDPAQAGFWVSVILVATEATILLVSDCAGRLLAVRKRATQAAVQQLGSRWHPSLSKF